MLKIINCKENIDKEKERDKDNKSSSNPKNTSYMKNRLSPRQYEKSFEILKADRK